MAPVATPVPAPAGTPSRSGDGLALTVALAVLLSLSSIAAIGGLVAISAQTIAPPSGTAITEPIESAASGTTIQVVPAVEEPRETNAASGGDSAGAPAPVSTTPQPAVAPPPAPSGADEGKGEEGNGGGGGGPRHSWTVEGAWCDAAIGSACDVAVGGHQPKADSGSTSVDATGFIPDDGDDLDEEGEDPYQPPGHSKHSKH
ncbi:MAG: hypothetical protein ACRDH9_12585 [Actinomycetota bacterium]